MTRAWNYNQDFPPKAGTSNTTQTEDPHSPFYLHHNDNHASVTATPKLNKDNYAPWSHSFLLALSIQTKTGFVDGSIAQPPRDDPIYAAWIRCNNIVVAWLLKSIVPFVTSQVYYHTSGAQIWTVLQKRYAQPNDVNIFRLQQKLYTATQCTRSVDDYFCELNTIWEELKLFRPLPYCSCGECNDNCFSRFVEAQEKDYLFKFLNGLSDTYATIRTRIITMCPIPTLEDAFNMVLREETQRSVVVVELDPLGDVSAMAVHRKFVKKSQYNSEAFCQYCKKTGHWKDTCSKLVGYPVDFRVKSRANQVVSGSSGDNDADLIVSQGSTKSTTTISHQELVQQVQQLRVQLQLLNQSGSRDHASSATLTAMSQVQKVGIDSAKENVNANAGAHFQDNDWIM